MTNIVYKCSECGGELKQNNKTLKCTKCGREKVFNKKEQVIDMNDKYKDYDGVLLEG